MYARDRWIGALVPLFLIWVAGCSSMLGAMFQEQNWSDNYALEPGTQCTVPELIDGDPETIGKLQVPREARPHLGYTVIPSADAVITLPEVRHIGKIVILSDRLDGLQIHAYDASRDDWKLIKEFKGNVPPRLEVRTSVKTNKIRLKSQAIPARGSSSSFGRIFNVGPRDVKPPTVREVELYGLVEK